MLTNDQYITLKNDITSKLTFVYQGGTFDLHLANSRHDIIAEYYNTQATPIQNIWRTDMPIEEVICEVVMADFILLPTVQREAFSVICQARNLNMRKNTIRNSIQTILGNGTTSYNNIISASRKKASNFEYLFTTNNVSEVYGYMIEPYDILTALRT